ncbi:MAG: DnaB-like helicase C-terminal domain-containing protein [Anaerolineae bacterium]
MPKLSDLRESGSIEQDADVVMFIFQDDPDEDPERASIRDILVAKHRNGPLGRISLHFDASHTRFADLETACARGFLRGRWF